jgi:acid phosphatase (class A)
MVPERRQALLARADEFARQRMVCGVHFASDIAAGRVAAEWLVRELDQQPGYRSEKAETTAVLRAALKLPRAPPK